MEEKLGEAVAAAETPAALKKVGEGLGWGLLGVLGLALPAVAAYLGSQRKHTDPRVISATAEAYEMLGYALMAIDCCEFGKAAIALREADRCADVALTYAPEHSIPLPKWIAYGEESILIRHADDAWRLKSFFQNSRTEIELLEAQKPGAVRCKICDSRVGVGDPCVCDSCRADGAAAVAPSDALQAWFFERISEREERKAEQVRLAEELKAKIPPVPPVEPSP